MLTCSTNDEDKITYFNTANELFLNREALLKNVFLLYLS